jgi:hypothetical protein
MSTRFSVRTADGTWICRLHAESGGFDMGAPLDCGRCDAGAPPDDARKRAGTDTLAIALGLGGHTAEAFDPAAAAQHAAELVREALPGIIDARVRAAQGKLD